MKEGGNFLEKKKRPVQSGISKKDVSDALKDFCKESLEPKFEKIDGRFEKIDDRFEQMDKRFEQADFRFKENKEDIVHQFHVISEDLISKVKQVAEGVVNLNEKFDRRIDAIENKIDEKHQDILAAIKFSYAELDRRITTLEGEMADLKRRMDQLESKFVS
jgi:predicted nuclease with TOPRIM domain